MKPGNDTLMEKLGSLDPLRGAKPDPHLSDSARRELLDAIFATAPETSDGHGPRVLDRVKRKLEGRRALAPIAVGGIALLAIVIGLPGGGGGGHDPLSALDRIAAAAASQPPPPVALPYLYVKTRDDSIATSVWGRGQSWSNYESDIAETWIAKDGSGRERRVVAPPRFVGPGDREAWEAAGRPNFLVHGFDGYTEDRSRPPGTFDDRFYGGAVSLSDLPTDPAELSQWLTDRVTGPANRGNGNPLPVKVLVLIGEILSNPLATPELRAALYEATKEIPGIEYLGETTDVTGRHGIAVGATTANSGNLARTSLIVDPQTSQVLATEETALEPPKAMDAKAPFLLSTKVFLESGTTSSLSSKP